MNASMQSLEARKLFAAVTATLVSGKLTVTGTDGNDSITFADAPDAPDGSSRVAVYNRPLEQDPAPLAVFKNSQIRSILIQAGRGQDTVNLELGNYAKPTTVSGGEGDDTINADNLGNNSIVRGDAGNDQIESTGPVEGGDGNDTIVAYSHETAGPALLIHGNGGNDSIYGNGAADSLYGDSGDDTITVASTSTGFRTMVWGGDGRDTISALDAVSTIDAGTGDDLVNVSGQSTVHLGAGRDEVHVRGYRSEFGPFGPIQVYGDDDADAMYLSTPPFLTDFLDTFIAFHGGGGNDTINATGGFRVDFQAYGDAGNDTILGSGSADTLRGGDGDDVITGNYGANEIYGDAGNDRITGFDGGEKLYGGDGRDTIDGGGGNDLISGDADNDNLSGRAGNDTIYGGGGNDVLDGGIGNDDLHGDAGNDDLFGSDGNDTLSGGAGSNRFYGQKGVDTIHAKNGTVDHLFATGDGDVLDKDSFDVLS